MSVSITPFCHCPLVDSFSSIHVSPCLLFLTPFAISNALARCSLTAANFSSHGRLFRYFGVSLLLPPWTTSRHLLSFRRAAASRQCLFRYLLAEGIFYRFHHRLLPPLIFTSYRLIDRIFSCPPPHKICISVAASATTTTALYSAVDCTASSIAAADSVPPPFSLCLYCLHTTTGRR